MLFTSSLLFKAIKNRENYMKLTGKEGYSPSDSIDAGMSLGFVTGFLIIAIVFFMLELLVMFYCIRIALVCTSPGPERIVNMVLAIMFTFPYALLNIVFVPCAKQSLNWGR